jgi:hypothetical protein
MNEIDKSPVFGCANPVFHNGTAHGSRLRASR